jgi:hypothetical protein
VGGRHGLIIVGKVVAVFDSLSGKSPGVPPLKQSLSFWVPVAKILG